MEELNRRKVIGGIVATTTMGLAGCMDSDANPLNTEETSATEETTPEEPQEEMETVPEDYTYINGATEQLIGEEDEIEDGIQVELTEFAVSKHSAANEVLLLSEDEVTEEAVVNRVTIPESQSIVIPIPTATPTIQSIAVVDDELTELGRENM